MDNTTYEKVSDSQGNIVTTTTTTVNLSDLQTQLADLQGQLATVQSQEDDATTAYNNQLANFESQKKVIQTQIDAVNADIAGLQNVGVTAAS